jgi:hypothetical protein
MRRSRRNEVLQYWSDGFGPITQFSNILLLQYSNPPACALLTSARR